MNNKITNIVAALLLILMFCLALFSMAGDSLTMDEVAHLPAGYSYLTQKDMRLNPEHPPLIKDLAALPLLFIKGINFPSEIKDWKEDVNGQWGFGFNFLYHSNNPADQMIFWGRIPMILVLMLLGFYVFKWARELFGNKSALLALFLFAFSPTFITHGRLVTTDVGAATGVFIALYYFVKFLKNSSKKNLIISGLVLGLAELTKFSVILLLPLFGFLILIWAAIKSESFRGFLKSFGRYLLSFILLVAVAFVLIWGVYLYHVWNYPPDRQAADTEFMQGSTPFPIVRDTLIWAATNPVLRPLAQYGLGLAMVFQRAAGGNTMYFLGEVSAAGWKNYFPFVYAVKEPLAMHILTIIALLYAVWLIRLRASFAEVASATKAEQGYGGQSKKPSWQNFRQRLKNWLNSHFTEFAMLSFLVIYWAASLTSNLNLGVRHLLPTLPFVYILASSMIIKCLKQPYLKIKHAVLFILILWQAVSVVSIYPHFLAYFNEIVGGPAKGYLYTVDSNLDWGQDLKRLEKWVNENKIDKIYVDYFGGADAQYYLKEKFEPWWGSRDPAEMPKDAYLAVSVSTLQGGRGLAAKGSNLPTGYYRWLYQYEPPLAKIGYSIFVYRIK